MKNIRVAFFGNPDPSVTVVSALHIAGYTIACVVTKPPRPIGRSQILTPTPVAKWAKSNSVTIVDAVTGEKPWQFADESLLIKQVKSHLPDILVVADFTLKIPQELVESTRFHGLNIHPSLLPAYAGPSPVAYALIEGLTQTGVSVITLSNNLDQGTLIAQEVETINPDDTTPTLTQRLFLKGAQLLINVLPNYVAGTSTPIQTHSQPSYAPRLTRLDGFISRNDIKKAMTNDVALAVTIERKTRAFTPWPGVWTEVELVNDSDKNHTKKRLKILKSHLLKKDNLSQSYLELDEIQLEGKNPISGSDVKQLLQQLEA